MMAVRVGLWTLALQTLLRTTRALGDRPRGRHELGGPIEGRYAPLPPLDAPR